LKVSFLAPKTATSRLAKALGLDRNGKRISMLARAAVLDFSGSRYPPPPVLGILTPLSTRIEAGMLSC
jgi:hypothetical protein